MSISLGQFFGLAPYPDRTPPAKNDAAASLAAPAVSGPGVCTRNASQWHHVAEFLEDQQLETLGLRRVSGVEREARRGPACGVVPRAALCDLPDGNHGDNNLRTVSEVA